MVNNTLIVKFDHGCLDSSSSDSLCISKKVNGVYNVVFDNASPKPAVGQKKLLANNTFGFTTNYQIYFTQDYTNDALINSATDPKDISLGQYVEWQDNDLTDAAKADVKLLSADQAKASFAVKNAPKAFHVAVKASTGKSWSTIFVDPNQHMGGGTITITPKNEYILYWYNLTDTEYVHEVFEGDAFKFTFPPGDSTRTIRYGYATQNQPVEGSETPSFYIVGS
ncbi:hypothetical protein TWF506_000366 [Arthrobotrys conoides]|uniref:Uncharacterized protein n=1 Tax=Arthrobotrys conoides TaxID=74498 RepID=A0AAN8P015_9PEZI